MTLLQNAYTTNTTLRYVTLRYVNQLITKTRLFKYTENFTIKKWKFSDKKFFFVFIFLLKT